MIKHINFSDFCDGFPETYKNNFTYQGKRALFDYLEENEDESNPIEFDPIALCCEYSEYESADECASNYFDYEGMTYDEDGAEELTVDEVEAKALKYLEDRTQVIPVEGGRIIIADF